MLAGNPAGASPVQPDMRRALLRAVSLLIATGTLLLLVFQAGTGCSHGARPDPRGSQMQAVPVAPMPTEPVPSAAESKPAVAPDPVLYVGGGYLPATKAAPVFFPDKAPAQAPAQPPPQQQARP
jgi:hypothetical protein